MKCLESLQNTVGGVSQYKLGLIQLYQAMQIYSNTLRCTHSSSNHIKLNSGIKNTRQQRKHTTCPILMICPKSKNTQNGTPQNA